MRLVSGDQLLKMFVCSPVTLEYMFDGFGDRTWLKMKMQVDSIVQEMHAEENGYAKVPTEHLEEFLAHLNYLVLMEKVDAIRNFSLTEYVDGEKLVSWVPKNKPRKVGTFSYPKAGRTRPLKFTQYVRALFTMSLTHAKSARVLCYRCR